ncbi:MAG: hypothetical protein AAGD25_09185 [Cyanobacteria bacterium P01_F01_bin.150]
MILDRSDLDSVPEISVKNENKDFIHSTFEQLQVDILLTQNKLFRYILEKFSSARKFGDRTVQCVTVEGLLILKCYALPSLYRQGNFSRASIYENDILLLLLNYDVKPKTILSQLSGHLLPTDLKEVKDILSDIQSRIRRFSQQQRAMGGWGDREMGGRGDGGNKGTGNIDNQFIYTILCYPGHQNLGTR